MIRLINSNLVFGNLAFGILCTIIYQVGWNMALPFMFLIIYLIVFRDSLSNLKNMYWFWIIYLLYPRELKLGLYTCGQIRT